MKINFFVSLLLIAGCFLYAMSQVQAFRGELYADRQADMLQYDSLIGSHIHKKILYAEEQLEVLSRDQCVLFSFNYDAGLNCSSVEQCQQDIQVFAEVGALKPQPTCLDYARSRVETPESVRGIYMTSLAAASPNFRKRLVDIIDTTEINSVIIDIKEVDGYVAYSIGDEKLFPYQKNTMKDLAEFIELLHEKNIYTIARIVLFKDKVWAENHPEHAVLRKDNPDMVWTDYGGKKFIDPGAEPFWDYLVSISSSVYTLGFDEINADYIRFPSDGKLSNAYYPYSQNLIDTLGAEEGRVQSLNNFMEYYTEALREKHPNIVISADVFGMVTSLDNDLTIGQTLEPFLEYFDYVAPMVYPSHYGKGFVSLPGHPDNHPYEVIKKAMDDGIQKALASGHDPDKLRPWLQDFTCTWCAGYFRYGADELREQIQAVYDAGLDSWWLWSASNRYSVEGLLPNE